MSVAEEYVDGVRTSSCMVHVDSSSAGAASAGGVSTNSSGADGMTAEMRGEQVTRPCDSNELALLPPPDTWLAGLLLSFPLPMRADGLHELGCLA